MKQILRSFIVTIICNSLIFLPLVNVIAAENLALPSGDVIAPVIKQTRVPANIASTDLARIRATVTDNVGVKNVTVFYRDSIGETDFRRKEMKRDLATDDYVVTLPATMAPSIEYYIQATDQAGNTILHGHIFSPLKLSVSSGAPPQEGSGEVALVPQEDNVLVPPPKGISNWWWVGLGVLIIGAAAGSSSDSGGGGTPTATLSISTAEPVTP